MKRKKTHREAALCGHERRAVERYMRRSHQDHRILVKVGGRLVINATLGQLRLAEVERDGLSNVTPGCTCIEL